MLVRTWFFRVDTRTSAPDSLKSAHIPSYDVIVSDYLLPGMDGIAFLKTLREHYGDIPFILLTGQGCEDVVIEAINNKADGYLQKSGNPERLFTDLADKIKRAVSRKRTADALCESESKFNTFFQSSPVGLTVLCGEDETFAEVNDYFLKMTGYRRDEIIGKTAEDLHLFPDELEYRQMILAIRQFQSVTNFEIDCRSKSGELHVCLFTSNYLYIKKEARILSTIVDITSEKVNTSANQALLKSMIGTSGISSLPEISETISTWLKADTVIIAEREPERWQLNPKPSDLTKLHHKMLRIRSMIRNGWHEQDISWEVYGTPFQQILEIGELQVLDSGIQDLTFLTPVSGCSVHTAIGLPLRTSDGVVNGIMAILFRNPIVLSRAVLNTAEVIAVKVGSDIERDHVDQTLKENQLLLGEALDLAHLAYWEFDVRSGLFTFNDRFYGLYGTSVEQEGGYQMSADEYGRRFIHPEDIAANYQLWHNAMITPDPDYTAQIEHRSIRNLKDVRYILARFQIIKDKFGNTIRIYGANQDITAIKLADIKLHQYIGGLEYLSRRSVEMMDLNDDEDLFSFICSTIQMLTPPETVVIVNDADTSNMVMTTRSICGLTVDHLKALGDFSSSLRGKTYPFSNASINNMIHDGIEEYPGNFKDLTRNSFPEKVYHAIEKQHIIGKIYGVRLSRKKSLQGSVVIILPPDSDLENHFYIDIFSQLAAIELQRRQYALALQEERSLFISGPVVVFRWSPETGLPVRYVSPNVASQFGYSPDILKKEGCRYVSLIHPEDLDHFNHDMDFNVLSGNTTLEKEYRIKHKNGQYRWVYDFTHVERSEDGTITSYHGYILDIHERKKIEALLLESEKNAIALINANKESIIMIKTDGMVLFANETAAARIGYTPDQMVGRSWEEFINPEIGERRRKYVEAVLTEKKTIFYYR